MYLHNMQLQWVSNMSEYLVFTQHVGVMDVKYSQMSNFYKIWQCDEY